MNVAYSATPKGTMVFADFMARTGLFKTRPATWKDFFLPVVHDLPGT
jgi:NitT/TauT family transport system substrate-binding protein